MPTENEHSPFSRRRRALAVALLTLAVLPQCCCCVVPVGYGPRLVPGLRRVLPPSARSPLAAVTAPGPE